jgi:hypothetical protein
MLAQSRQVIAGGSFGVSSIADAKAVETTIRVARASVAAISVSSLEVIVGLAIKPPASSATH